MTAKLLEEKHHHKCPFELNVSKNHRKSLLHQVSKNFPFGISPDTL